MTDEATRLLLDVETLLMVVEPRSHKAEYIATLDRVRAYLSRPTEAIVPPRSPTAKMINAGRKAFMDNDDWGFTDIWQAMYDAAITEESQHE